MDLQKTKSYTVRQMISRLETGSPTGSHKVLHTEKPNGTVITAADSKFFRVLYPFSGAGDGHLQLETGDVIEVVNKTDSGWWLGKTRGVEGWFPTTFVEPLGTSSKNGYHNKAFAHERGTKKATKVVVDKSQIVKLEQVATDKVFDSERPTTVVQLEREQAASNTYLNIGAVENHRDEPDATDLPKENGYREEPPSLDSPPRSPSAKSQSEYSQEFEEFDNDDHSIVGVEYITMYPYDQQQPEDLAFTAGETVVVFEVLDNGWWRGCIGDREGWFPGSYVKMVEENEEAENLEVDISASYPYLYNGSLVDLEDDSLSSAKKKESRRASVKDALRARLSPLKPQLSKMFVKPNWVKVRLPQKLKNRSGILGERKVKPAPLPPVTLTKTNRSDTVSEEDNADVETNGVDNHDTSLFRAQSQGDIPFSISLSEVTCSTQSLPRSPRRKSAKIVRPSEPPPAPPPSGAKTKRQVSDPTGTIYDKVYSPTSSPTDLSSSGLVIEELQGAIKSNKSDIKPKTTEKSRQDSEPEAQLYSVVKPKKPNMKPKATDESQKDSEPGSELYDDASSVPVRLKVRGEPRDASFRQSYIEDLYDSILNEMHKKKDGDTSKVEIDGYEDMVVAPPPEFSAADDTYNDDHLYDSVARMDISNEDVVATVAGDSKRFTKQLPKLPEKPPPVKQTMHANSPPSEEEAGQSPVKQGLVKGMLTVYDSSSSSESPSPKRKSHKKEEHSKSVHGMSNRLNKIFNKDPKKGDSSPKESKKNIDVTVSDKENSPKKTWSFDFKPSSLLKKNKKPGTNAIEDLTVPEGHDSGDAKIVEGHTSPVHKDKSENVFSLKLESLLQQSSPAKSPNHRTHISGNVRGTETASSVSQSPSKSRSNESVSKTEISLVKVHSPIVDNSPDVKSRENIESSLAFSTQRDRPVVAVKPVNFKQLLRDRDLNLANGDTNMIHSPDDEPTSPSMEQKERRRPSIRTAVLPRPYQKDRWSPGDDSGFKPSQPSFLTPRPKMGTLALSLENLSNDSLCDDRIVNSAFNLRDIYKTSDSDKSPTGDFGQGYSRSRVSPNVLPKPYKLNTITTSPVYPKISNVWDRDRNTQLQNKENSVSKKPVIPHKPEQWSLPSLDDKTTQLERMVASSMTDLQQDEVFFTPPQSPERQILATATENSRMSPPKLLPKPKRFTSDTRLTRSTENLADLALFSDSNTNNTLSRQPKKGILKNMHKFHSFDHSLSTSHPALNGGRLNYEEAASQC